MRGVVARIRVGEGRREKSEADRGRWDMRYVTERKAVDAEGFGLCCWKDRVSFQ